MNKETHMSPLSVRLGTAVLLGGLASSALAQVPSPIGAWTTIDDETKKPKSIVRITERDGVYRAGQRLSTHSDCLRRIRL